LSIIGLGPARHTHCQVFSAAYKNCYHLDPEKAQGYHQAEIDKMNASGIHLCSGLSVSQSISDMMILNSGATKHYLKHKEYFVTF